MANGAQRAGPQAAIIAHPVPTKRRKPLQKTAGARLAGAKAAAIAFGEVRGNPTPMAVSDQDLIECWFGTLTVPEIVKKLDLKSNSELRLQWRRLKDLGKLPPRSREGVDGESGKLSPLVTALAVRSPAQRAIAQRFRALAPLGPPRMSALPLLQGLSGYPSAIAERPQFMSTRRS